MDAYDTYGNYLSSSINDLGGVQIDLSTIPKNAYVYIVVSSPVLVSIPYSIKAGPVTYVHHYLKKLRKNYRCDLDDDNINLAFDESGFATIDGKAKTKPFIKIAGTVCDLYYGKWDFFNITIPPGYDTVDITQFFNR